MSFDRNLGATEPVVSGMLKTFWRMLAPVVIGLAFVFANSVRAAEVRSGVDWSKFLARHDLIWDSPAKDWESGAFIGNGLLGAMIYSGGTNVLQWDVGRSDVTDKGDRVAIGRFVLKLARPVSSSTMRLDLWNAEA